MSAALQSLRRDPLLAAAQLACAAGMVLSALVAGSCALGVPALLVAPAMLDGMDAPTLAAISRAPGIVVAILLAVAAMAGAAFAFLRLLRGIVTSVGAHDPFAPANARRLAMMGWLTVGIEALAGLVTLLGNVASRVVHEATLDFSIDPGGLLLAIVLFILARVFREGARMRDDLEGTV